MTKKTAVLLLAFGGPDSLEEVKPFLGRVLSGMGRRPDQTQIERAIGRYKAIGGRSPLLDITLSQAHALEETLKSMRNSLKVYVGMRYWHPFIEETLKDMLRDGIERIMALSLAPHNSKAASGGYVREVERALKEMEASSDVSFVKSWHTHPIFLEALKEKIEEGLSNFLKKDREEVQLIFSVHSLPIRLVQGDPYVEQVKESIEGVLELFGPLSWHLAFQSKGGGPGEWLGPDVESVLAMLAERGDKKVLLVPVGFVSDHVETLYDIDIYYKRIAESKGITFRRSPSLNASSRFIEALASIVCENLKDQTDGGVL